MSSPHRITLDELFGASTAPVRQNAAEPNETRAMGFSTPSPSPTGYRGLSPSPLPSMAQLVRGVRSDSADGLPDLSGSDEGTSPHFRGVQRANADYSAISTTVSREPTHGSCTVFTSTTSRASASTDCTSSFFGSAGKRLPAATPSTSAFSDLASEDAAGLHGDGAANGGESVFSTLALLRRFLAERQRISAESSHSNRAPSVSSTTAHTLPSHGSQVFDALRTAHLVPSVVPAVAAAEVNEDSTKSTKPERNPYLIESSYMRASTLAAVVKRQKAERHAAYSAAHPFFSSSAPLASLTAAAASTNTATAPLHLPAVLDMPLHLRCSMCQKHDSMCNRCHRRWGKLQESYREEAAQRCYSTLDVNRRGVLSLLTAALGTGAFLEMMSIADGLTLTQTRVCVPLASLEFLLKVCGRVVSAEVEGRLARAENPAHSSHEIWLKVAHVGCLFGQRDVLRSLWLRCRGGCSYAAQITTNGLHALELLPEPYEPALLAVMHKCAALREYLLWARIMQCLAVRAADDTEATQLCAELRGTGSWVGVWSEALLAYVKGNKERCVELCDALLLGAGEGPAAAANAEEEPPNLRADLPRGTSTISFSSSFVEALTPPPPASAPSVPSQPLAGAGAALSVRPAIDVDRIHALRELALRPEEPLPRLEAFDEEAATPPPRALTSPHDSGKELMSQPRVLRLSVRRLAFPLMRRILSYCDAPTLVRVHTATPMPLLQWITLARVKCLSAAQWTQLLCTNTGYAKLLQTLCAYEPPSVPTREEREEATEAVPTRADAVMAMVCPPFQPIRVSVADIHDLGHLTVKAVLLGHRAIQKDNGEKPRTVGQWLLESVFGRATSLVSDSNYLVLSCVYQLAAPDERSNVANADVSEWRCTRVQPWEVDVHATIRWCTYVLLHPEAEKLL